MSSARAYQLAWMMFARRCALDGAAPGMDREAWMDNDIRAFWLAEAEAVLVHLEGTAA